MMLNSVSRRIKDRLRVFEKRVLKKITGPKRSNTTVEKKGKEELHNLYYSPNIIGVIK
jgi:hypothetical protein